jgi:hypothetical protein
MAIVAYQKTDRLTSHWHQPPTFCHESRAMCENPAGQTVHLWQDLYKPNSAPLARFVQAKRAKKLKLYGKYARLAKTDSKLHTDEFLPKKRQN